MSAGAVHFLVTLARETGGKVADHRVARACGVSEHTARAWRYGERRIQPQHSHELRRLRAERARRMIAEAERELAALNAEATQQ